MARDWVAQAESLRKLPAAFWLSLGDDEKKLARAAESLQSQFENHDTGSLTACLAHTLNQEEPIVLSIYAPLIRLLRSHWTDLALDFYVLIQLHLARLIRLIQGYAGDPALSQRCSILLAKLEKETQTPEEEVVSAPARKVRKTAPSAKRATNASAGHRQVRSPKTRESAPEKRVPKRAKPIIKKIKISRRRARG